MPYRMPAVWKWTLPAMAMTMGLNVLSALAAHDPGDANARSFAAPWTIPSGQKFIMRLETAIHTNYNKKGDPVLFETAGDIVAEENVVIPQKSKIRGVLTRSKRAGRLAGKAEVEIKLQAVEILSGPLQPIQATIIRVGLDPIKPDGGDPTIKGDSGSGGSAGTVAKSGAEGAVIGVLMGGPKGAAYGGAVGAGIALGGMLLKRGPDLDLPADTMFEARFDNSFTLPPELAQQVEKATSQSDETGRAETEPTIRENEKPSFQREKPVLHTRNKTRETPSPAPADGDESLGGRRSDPTEKIDSLPRPVPAPEIPKPEPKDEPVALEPASTGSENFKLRVSVRMVQVDTVVRDRAGRMIDNLKLEDFRVFEDGQEQTLGSYSRDEMPLALALVVDASGSVAPYIYELRRIAQRTLAQLKGQDQVALFSFASDAERIVDLTSDRRAIADGLNRIHPGGGTNIVDALYQAVNYLANAAPDSRRAVILISDNQSTVPSSAGEGETIRKALNSETVIYSIKTAGDSGPVALRVPSIRFGGGSVSKMCRETGGEIIDAARAGLMNAALEQVLTRLRLRYSVGYYSSSTERGGAFHSIEVRLQDRFGKPGADYVIHARRGYYSTGS